MQRKVHELRQKLVRLKASVGEAKLPQNFTIKNKNFSVALGRIESEANEISNKIKELQLEEKDLKTFFQKLMDDFNGLKRNLRKLEAALNMAFNSSGMAKMDIGDAEDMIEQIKKLLDGAKYDLDVNGRRAYNEARKLAKDISDLAKRMKSIAAEVSYNFFYI